MMMKYRVREVAKDLDIPNKEVLDTLAKYFPEPKKYMTALEENELDVVFEAFTQERNMENLDAYFAQREKPKAAPVVTVEEGTGAFSVEKVEIPHEKQSTVS